MLGYRSAAFHPEQVRRQRRGAHLFRCSKVTTQTLVAGHITVAQGSIWLEHVGAQGQSDSSHATSCNSQCSLGLHCSSHLAE
jgi:hypothetical protein